MGSTDDKKTSCSNSLFTDLDADAMAPEIMEIESLCLRCGKNGTTRLLLTKIPFYKEVVVMSFNCTHCHWHNNELQPAAMIQEKGIQYKLRVSTNKDLHRQVVKTEWASVKIPEINLEVPQCSQEGTVSTVEGVLRRAYDGINERQKSIELEDPDSASKLMEFLNQLKELLEARTPFTFILRDCSGNSFVENICAPQSDPSLGVMNFERSIEESVMLGIVSQGSPVQNSENNKKTNNMVDAGGGDDDDDDDDDRDMKNEVLKFATNCSNCNAPCVTNMKLTHIPLFKDVVIMATVCENCGHKTNEVKSGAGIEPRGVRYTLKIMNEKDLGRDLIKSDTCKISIPELELEVGSTAFSGCYTTVEGLITNMKKQLVDDNPFFVGDSAQSELKNKMTAFFETLKKVLDGSFRCTLILDDPCGNSYIQSIHYPDVDVNLVVDKYERTFEQNDELGLNDMKVENYEET